MKTIGAYEAKTKWSQLLAEVKRGESITITRHGEPIARLVPVEPGRKMTKAEAIEAIKAFQKAHTLGSDLTIRELIEEGRPWRGRLRGSDPGRLPDDHSPTAPSFENSASCIES